MSEIRHALRKLGSTLRLAGTLICARTFGQYEISVWNGEFSYARYTWRGRSWAFPTSPFDKLDDDGAPMRDPLRIFEMTPREFSGIAMFGLVSLAGLMLLGVAIVQGVR